MAEATVLDTVKTMLGVTGNYQDGTMQAYIDEVKQYMLSGGVSEEIVEASISAGTIARGVADLWNYGAGAGEFSPHFKERVIQLALKSKSATPNECETIDYKALAEKLLAEVEKKNV